MSEWRWCKDMEGGEYGKAWADWKFCPICGAERPKEKKMKLWEILRGSYFSYESATELPKDTFERVATAAIEAVERVIDELKMGGIMVDLVNAETLKRRLREML